MQEPYLSFVNHQSHLRYWFFSFACKGVVSPTEVILFSFKSDPPSSSAAQWTALLTFSFSVKYLESSWHLLLSHFTSYLSENPVDSNFKNIKHVILSLNHLSFILTNVLKIIATGFWLKSKPTTARRPHCLSLGNSLISGILILCLLYILQLLSSKL